MGNEYFFDCFTSRAIQLQFRGSRVANHVYSLSTVYANMLEAESEQCRKMTIPL